MIKASDVTILIVDDEPGIVEALSINFALDGFNICTASGGIEAIEILKKNKINFVISDVHMPKGDGILLLNYISDYTPKNPPILLFSGYTEVTAEKVKLLGGIDLYPKPPNINDMISIIKLYCNCS